MKKTLLVGVLALATLFASQAQDNKSRLADIRSWYPEAVSQADEMAKSCNGPCSMVTATVKRMESPVGAVTYQNQYYSSLGNSLSFFRCKRTAINSTKNIEILYKDGKVAFYFEKDKEEAKETRVYYNENGVPFKALQNGREMKLEDYEYEYIKRFADLEIKKYENAVSTGLYADVEDGD